MGVRHREAAVFNRAPPSRLIRSSSPGARGEKKKGWCFSILSARGHCLLYLLDRVLLAPCRKIPLLVLLASLRPACSLRWICSSTHAFVSVRTKPQRRQWQQPQPASKTCSTPTLQISPKLPISFFFLFFVFLTTAGLCYFFAFYLFIRLSFFSFCTAGSSNPPENSTFPVPPARMCSRSSAALPLCAVLCN